MFIAIPYPTLPLISHPNSPFRQPLWPDSISSAPLPIFSISNFRIEEIITFLGRIIQHFCEFLFIVILIYFEKVWWSRRGVGIDNKFGGRDILQWGCREASSHLQRMSERLVVVTSPNPLMHIHLEPHCSTVAADKGLWRKRRRILWQRQWRGSACAMSWRRHHNGGWGRWGQWGRRSYTTVARWGINQVG